MTNIGHHNNMMTSHQATEPTAFGVLFYHSWRWKQPVSTSSIQLIQPTKSWVQNHFFQNTSRIFPWARHPAGVSNKQVKSTEMVVILACSLETEKSWSAVRSTGDKVQWRAKAACSLNLVLSGFIFGQVHSAYAMSWIWSFLQNPHLQMTKRLK